ncbi:MAG: NUDIX hydrolase [Chloroflexota bacterium]
MVQPNEQSIRLRVCVVVRQDDQILLVPHYRTDAGPIQWTIPGGAVEFGERLRDAAKREFEEETGLLVEIEDLFDISEVIPPDRPWHSVTICFAAKIVGGHIRPEPNHPYGDKTPRWLSAKDLADQPYHPPKVIEKALRFAQFDN